MRLKQIPLGLIALIVAAVTLSSLPARAQGDDVRLRNVKSDSVRVFFRQGKAIVEPAFEQNGDRFASVAGKLQTFADDSLMRVDRIRILASSSPEGSVAGNKALAKKRAAAIDQYILRNHSFLGADLVLDYKDVDWALFESLVKDDPDVPSKEQALEAIGKQDIAALKRAKGAWNYLYNNTFPALRSTVAVFEYELLFPAEMPELEYPEIELYDYASTLSFPRLNTGIAPPEPVALRHRYDFYLKTNLLSWPLLEANAALEFEIAPHLSFSLPVYYSGVNWFTSTMKFRVLGTQPELRWWLKREEFKGPFIGAHFTFGIYNIALGSSPYRFQDNGKPAIGGGLNVGYKFRFPFLRDKLGLELSVGAGYLDLNYDIFANTDNGRYIDRDVHKNYWGIDHAAVTLTYRFNKSLWQ